MIPAFTPAAHAQLASRTVIPGPAGSSAFGSVVTLLPNGNFVVSDPAYSEGGVVNRGMAALYDGVTLQLISLLKGGHADQFTGSSVTVLANGHFVVVSPDARSAPSCKVTMHAEAGAVTWGDAETGFGAPVAAVSAANSLVGVAAEDGATCEPSAARRFDVVPLPNGSYLVASSRWHSGDGAVTWADGSGGSGGTVGMVSTANSLTGLDNHPNGSAQIIVLPNGNYLVFSGA